MKLRDSMGRLHVGDAESEPRSSAQHLTKRRDRAESHSSGDTEEDTHSNGTVKTGLTNPDSQPPQKDSSKPPQRTPFPRLSVGYRAISGRDYPSLWSYMTAQWTGSLLQDRVSQEGSARISVYNTLLRVPYHLERFIWAGVMCCLNTLVTLVTVVPLRTVLHCMKSPIRSGVLFDAICCVVVWTGVYIHVAYLEPGLLYFGMKDVTAEFLKITLVYVALDVADKILSNVGVDVMRMLIESCELYCTGQTQLPTLLLDSLLFLIVTWIHSGVVMSMAMVCNFGEIKTTVFKRFDAKKLFILCRMDIVERLNLFLATLFIAVEDSGQIGEWQLSRDILVNCVSIIVLESIVDIVKHSVVVNFNGVRPGIYREFLRDVFQAHLDLQEEGTIKQLVFEPIGSCILFLRVLLSALSIGSHPMHFRFVLAMGCCLALLVVKILMGWILEWTAVWYLQYFQAHYGEQPTLLKNIKQS